MSVQKETYIIYGVKFGEEFTLNFWEEDFRDEMEWEEEKGSLNPFFITDGMNGNYTFFGFIKQLSYGWDDDDEKELELSFDYNKDDIISKFSELYPESKIEESDIKLYYLPHWV